MAKARPEEGQTWTSTRGTTMWSAETHPHGHPPLTSQEQSNGTQTGTLSTPWLNPLHQDAHAWKTVNPAHWLLFCHSGYIMVNLNNHSPLPYYNVLSHTLYHYQLHYFSSSSFYSQKLYSSKIWNNFTHIIFFKKLNT